MTRTEIATKVQNFLVEDFELDAEAMQDENARLKEDVGIDSLDFVDIVVITEREFGFKPVPAELKNAKTLGQFYDYIARNLV